MWALEVCFGCSIGEEEGGVSGGGECIYGFRDMVGILALIALA